MEVTTQGDFTMHSKSGILEFVIYYVVPTLFLLLLVIAFGLVAYISSVRP